MTGGRRVPVTGCAGAGKTTFARALTAKRPLPLVRRDREDWRPGRIEPPEEAWRARGADLVRHHAWIMDGNDSRTVDLRFPAAGRIIWLDFPGRPCLWRVLRRMTAHHAKVSHDMTPGGPGRFDPSFLSRIRTRPVRSRPKAFETPERCGCGEKLVRLPSPAAARHYLSAITPP